jgi:hypothetical protein
MSLDKHKACEQSGCTPTRSKLSPAPSSDLKQLYLSRQQLQNNIVIIPQLFN